MVNALAKRAPRSSARIDPVARIVFGGIPNSPATAPRRVDDLGSVQDARKMSTDGQPHCRLRMQSSERRGAKTDATLAVSEQTAAIQQQAVELTLALISDAMSDRFLRSVSLL